VIPDGKTKVKSEVRRRRPQHSDEQLLGAATEVFAREGYAAASVARIAAAAGATKPTLYARFGSKTELFEAATRHQAEALLPQLFEAYARASGLPLADAIRAGVDAWFAFARARPDGMALLFGQDAGVSSPVVDQTLEAIIGRIAAVVSDHTRRSGVEAGDNAQVIAAMLVGTAVHAIRRCLSDPKLRPDAVRELTSSFLIGAMRGLDPALVAAG
jgi:AcrR family transcriptional regulator